MAHSSRKSKQREMDTTSWLGFIVFNVLKMIVKLLKPLFNLFLKGLGDEVFNEVLEGVSEIIRAYNHKDSTGNAINISYGLKSIKECREVVDNDISKHREKRKK